MILGVMMGSSVEFQAKIGCEDQINAAYAAMTGKPDASIVHSARTIEANIAYIHSPKGEGQAHLRPCLKTVADWDALFPAWKRGTGQIKISGVGDDEVERIAEIKRDIQFLLDNRMLFTRITGLDDARANGYATFEGDQIEGHKATKRPPSSDPTFADLPKGQSGFYKLCVENDRPDLWSAYLRFDADPCENTWVELRQKVVPWKGIAPGLWEMVEQLATERDGKDFGLMGRFRDGNVPPLMLVRMAPEPVAGWSSLGGHKRSSLGGRRG